MEYRISKSSQPFLRNQFYIEQKNDNGFWHYVDGTAASTAGYCEVTMLKPYEYQPRAGVWVYCAAMIIAIIMGATI